MNDLDALLAASQRHESAHDDQSENTDKWLKVELKFSKSHFIPWGRKVIRAVDIDDCATLANIFATQSELGADINTQTTSRGYGGHMWSAWNHMFIGDTILHLAIKQHKLLCVQVLLLLKADITIRNAENFSCEELANSLLKCSLVALLNEGYQELFPCVDPRRFHLLPDKFRYRSIEKEAWKIMLAGRNMYTELPKTFNYDHLLPETKKVSQLLLIPPRAPWRRQLDKKGNLYYYNEITTEIDVISEQEMKLGRWEKVTNEHGYDFYVNELTGRSQRNKPLDYKERPSFAPSAASRQRRMTKFNLSEGAQAQATSAGTAKDNKSPGKSPLKKKKQERVAIEGRPYQQRAAQDSDGSQAAVYVIAEVDEDQEDLLIIAELKEKMIKLAIQREYMQTEEYKAAERRRQQAEELEAERARLLELKLLKEREEALHQQEVRQRTLLLHKLADEESMRGRMAYRARNTAQSASPVRRRQRREYGTKRSVNMRKPAPDMAKAVMSADVSVTGAGGESNASVASSSVSVLSGQSSASASVSTKKLTKIENKTSVAAVALPSSSSGKSVKMDSKSTKNASAKSGRQPAAVEEVVEPVVVAPAVDSVSDSEFDFYGQELIEIVCEPRTAAPKAQTRKDKRLEERTGVSLTSGGLGVGDVWPRDALCDIVKMLHKQQRRQARMDSADSLKKSGLTLLAAATRGAGGGGGRSSAEGTGGFMGQSGSANDIAGGGGTAAHAAWDGDLGGTHILTELGDLKGMKRLKFVKMTDLTEIVRYESASTEIAGGGGVGGVNAGLGSRRNSARDRSASHDSSNFFSSSSSMRRKPRSKLTKFDDDFLYYPYRYVTELSTYSNLKYMKVGNPGIVQLGEVLRTDKNVTSLCFARARISFGLKRFADALPMIENLTYLDLSENAIGDDDVTALAHALITTKKLTKLSLMANRITMAGAKILFHVVLGLNCSVMVLSIANNRINKVDKLELLSRVQDFRREQDARYRKKFHMPSLQDEMTIMTGSGDVATAQSPGNSSWNSDKYVDDNGGDTRDAVGNDGDDALSLGKHVSTQSHGPLTVNTADDAAGGPFGLDSASQGSLGRLQQDFADYGSSSVGVSASRSFFSSLCGVMSAPFSPTRNNKIAYDNSNFNNTSQMSFRADSLAEGSSTNNLIAMSPSASLVSVSTRFLMSFWNSVSSPFSRSRNHTLSMASANGSASDDTMIRPLDDDDLLAAQQEENLRAQEEVMLSMECNYVPKTIVV